MFCLLQPFFQRFIRCVWKIKLKHACVIVAIIVLLDVFGVFTHMFEVSYNDNFIYPYNGEVGTFVHALKRDKKPDVQPINEYNYDIVHGEDKCSHPDYATLRLVFLVKSAAEHFDRRMGIRQSWGFGMRFYDVPTVTVFLLGIRPNNVELQDKINAESNEHKDILQADFVDSYYNNTIKTMMGFKWAVQHCKHAKFYMFVDDDMYVSVKNVIRFTRNPAYYPDYLEEPSRIALRKREIKDSVKENTTALDSTAIQQLPNKNQENHNSTIGKMEKKISKRATAKEKIMMRRRSGWDSHNKTKMPITRTIENVSTTDVTNFLKNEHTVVSHLPELSNNSTNWKLTPNRTKRQIFDLELSDEAQLFAGYVIESSPHRHRTSKWYVSLKEYPYHMWPPYVTAGAYVLSKEALLDLYYTSLYTQHFRFDDIFLGIVAKKAHIEPFHCDEFHFYKKDYTLYNYKYVITSHGYDDPNELQQVWNEQKSLGNA